VGNHVAHFFISTCENTMTQDATQDTAPEAKAAPKAVKAPKATHKKYITSETHTIPIDVQIQGEMINGEWSAKEGYVSFSVPLHLVEGFEKHYHFAVGNIVAAE
jgi:hypothetical protein